MVLAPWRVTTTALPTFWTVLPQWDVEILAVVGTDAVSCVVGGASKAPPTVSVVPRSPSKSGPSKDPIKWSAVVLCIHFLQNCCMTTTHLNHQSLKMGIHTSCSTQLHDHSVMFCACRRCPRWRWFARAGQWLWCREFTRILISCPHRHWWMSAPLDVEVPLHWTLFKLQHNFLLRLTSDLLLLHWVMAVCSHPLQAVTRTGFWHWNSTATTYLFENPKPLPPSRNAGAQWTIYTPCLDRVGWMFSIAVI